MILKFSFIALNSKSDCTLQILPTEIVNKNMERFNLHPGPTVKAMTRPKKPNTKKEE